MTMLGLMAAGIDTVVGNPTVPVTCGSTMKLVVGLVKLGSEIWKGTPAKLSDLGAKLSKMPAPPRNTVRFPHGRQAKPRRGAKLLRSVRMRVSPGNPKLLASTTPT